MARHGAAAAYWRKYLAAAWQKLLRVFAPPLFRRSFAARRGGTGTVFFCGALLLCVLHHLCH